MLAVGLRSGPSLAAAAGRPARPAPRSAARPPGPVAGGRWAARCSSTPTWCWPTPWPPPRWPAALLAALIAAGAGAGPVPGGPRLLVGVAAGLARGRRCCGPRRSAWAPPWPWPAAVAVLARRVRLAGAPPWWPCAAVAAQRRGLAWSTGWPPAPSWARRGPGVPHVGGRLVGRRPVAGAAHHLAAGQLPGRRHRRRSPWGWARVLLLVCRPDAALAPTTAPLGGGRRSSARWPATWCAWWSGRPARSPGWRWPSRPGWFLPVGRGPPGADGVPTP